MALSSNAAAELLNPAAATVFFKAYEALARVYTQWCNVETSVKAYEESFRVSGIGSFVTKPEGTPVAYDEPVVGDRKRTLHSTFALGIRIPMELMEDDQFGVIARMPDDLGESARDHEERLTHALLNDAWAGASFTGMPEGDGTARSLYNTGHVPMKATGTDSNRASPGVAFSVTGLQDAVTNVELQTNEEGREIIRTAAIVVHHPNERWNVETILRTDRLPGSADNDINLVATSQLGIVNVSTPYLTDTDGWHLLTNKERHSLKLFRRKGLAFDRGRDMDTFDSKFTAHWRGHATFDDWRGCYGSAPGV